jgi:hypothetical protein
MKKDPETGAMAYPKLELLRLAIPRRVYTDTHMRYVALALKEIYEHRSRVKGMRIVSAPSMLRHFTAVLEPIHQPDRSSEKIDDHRRFVASIEQSEIKATGKLEPICQTNQRKE